MPRCHTGFPSILVSCQLQFKTCSHESKLNKRPQIWVGVSFGEVKRFLPAIHAGNARYSYGFSTFFVTRPSNFSQIKCDGAVPNCFWCEHYKTRCAYERHNLHPFPPRASKSSEQARVPSEDSELYWSLRLEVSLTSDSQKPQKPVKVLAMTAVLPQGITTIGYPLVLSHQFWLSVQWCICMAPRQ